MTDSSNPNLICFCEGRFLVCCDSAARASNAATMRSTTKRPHFIWLPPGGWFVSIRASKKIHMSCPFLQHKSSPTPNKPKLITAETASGLLKLLLKRGELLAQGVQFPSQFLHFCFKLRKSVSVVGNLS